MATEYKVQAQFPATSKSVSYSYISNVAITTYEATITTASNHGITQVGTVVKIQGVNDTFDGYQVIETIPTTTTFTFASNTATFASTAISPNGIATFIPVTSGFIVSNAVIQNYVATLTTTTSHDFVVGDYVAIDLGISAYDTLKAQIIGTPSATTFCYAVSTQSLTSASLAYGAVGKTAYTSSYTVPTGKSGISSTLYVCNTSEDVEYYSIAMQKGGDSLSNQWISRDAKLNPGTYIALTTGMSLSAGEILTFKASSNMVIFTLDGSEVG